MADVSYGGIPRVSMPSSGGALAPGSYTIGGAQPRKAFRSEYGVEMTDAEYGDRKAKDADSQRQADEARATATWRAQQPQGSPATTPMSLSAIQGAAGPLYSNYTGSATSQLDADRAKLDLERSMADPSPGRIAANNADFDKRFAAIKDLAGQPLAGDSGSGPTVDPAKEQAARDAAFARAKEHAGSTALASLKALQDVFAGRGQTGSSMETRAIGSTVGGAASAVTDFDRDQLIGDVNRAADISDRESQASLTKRGQDVNMRQSLMAILNATGGLY